jgi:hypothetical protein
VGEVCLRGRRCRLGCIDKKTYSLQCIDHALVTAGSVVQSH